MPGMEDIADYNCHSITEGVDCLKKRRWRCQDNLDVHTNR